MGNPIIFMEYVMGYNVCLFNLLVEVPHGCHDIHPLVVCYGNHII